MRELANAMGITVAALYVWPEELQQKHIDRIAGAALRLGIAFEVDGEVMGRDRMTAGAAPPGVGGPTITHHDEMQALRILAAGALARAPGEGDKDA